MATGDIFITIPTVVPAGPGSLAASARAEVAAASRAALDPAGRSTPRSEGRGSLSPGNRPDLEN